MMIAFFILLKLHKLRTSLETICSLFFFIDLPVTIHPFKLLFLLSIFFWPTDSSVIV